MAAAFIRGVDGRISNTASVKSASPLHPFEVKALGREACGDRYTRPNVDLPGETL
jgi:hypothetical protein